MPDRLYRTQILLEPEQHEELSQIARREGRSVSDVIREMLRQQLEQRKSSREETRKRRLAALERIRQHREEILKERDGKPIDVDLVEMLHQMREEQDERNLTNLISSGD